MSNYALTLLDGPEGSVSTEAHDLNSSGQVVGTAWIDSEPWKTEGHRALLWNNGVMIDLGTLGGQYSSGQAINDLGQIVGATTRPDNSAHGFLINPEDTDGNGTPDRWFRDFNGDGANDLMVQLPLSPTEINNLGQVVGGNSLWTPATPNGTTGALTDLGLVARAINDAGQVVGWASIDATDRAVLWQSGVMTDLGAGRAFAINRSGQITGYSAIGYWAFLWTPTTPNGSAGTLSILPGSDGWSGSYAAAFGLNNVGQVIGVTGFVSSGGDDGGGGAGQGATLWDGGIAQSLNALLVASPNQPVLEHADAINDAAEIVGHTAGAFVSTSPHQAFLLTPIDAPINVPLITISDVTLTEGNTGTRAATFTVTLSAASTQPVTVAYATGNNTAMASSDYEAASDTLTFAPGETEQSVNVLVNGDTQLEVDEVFTVNLSSAVGATIADGQGIGTIVNDDVTYLPPTITISDVTKAEGRKGQKTLFTFTVTLSVASTEPVTISYRTVNGTATTGNNDYVAKSGTITFAPGETTKTITVSVRGDNRRESDEVFYLDLSDLSGEVSFAKSRGIGTIVNDD